jgi:hypothetical protein
MFQFQTQMARDASGADILGGLIRITSSRCQVSGATSTLLSEADVYEYTPVSTK